MHGVPAESIVITGASSGIGRELALQMAAPGMEIWLIGRAAWRLEEVAELVRQKGALARTVQIDLRDLDEAARFLEETFPAERRVDVVYLAAAVTMFGEVKDVRHEDWNRIYTTNFLSPVQWMLHFYKQMVARRAGRIILISSMSAYTGYPTATAYAAMKAGLLGLFRSLSPEGETHNVALHLVSPGYIDTGIYRSAIYRGTSYERTMDQIKGLGFPILPVEKAARIILRSVRRGKREFSFPSYARLIIWWAPRVPFFIALIHSGIVRRFRKVS